MTKFNPSELRELARRIEGEDIGIMDLSALDDWADDVADWAEDAAKPEGEGSDTAPDRPALPEPLSAYFRGLIVAALRQQADDVEAMAAFCG